MLKKRGKSRGSSDVPQSTLQNIRVVVDSCASGDNTADKILNRTGLSARHVSYALAAARAIGLVSKEGRDCRLTSIGRHLSESLPGSEEERQILQEAIAASPIMRVIAPNLLSMRSPERRAFTAHLRSSGGLSASTSMHRASMLLRWRKELLSEQKRLLRGLKEQGMWRRIEIKNFRSLANATVTLAPFTVVVGPNGSGKSNFADALVFARDVAFDASTAISSRGGISGVRRWRPSKPTDVSIDVRAASSEPALDTDHVHHFLKIHSGKQGEWNFSAETIEVVSEGAVTSFVKRRGASLESSPKVSTPSDSASAMVSARQLRDFSKVSALHNIRRYRLNPDEMRQPQLSTEESRLKETGDNIAAAIQSIRDSNQIDRVLEPMSRIVPGLQDIYIEQVGRFLALKFKQMQEEGAVADFNATEMSEGALRALGIIVATSQMDRDELLVIEEPEVSIHVGAANLLFDVLKEASQRGAVLLTTHSADLLDAAKNEEILVCDYRDGITRIGPLSDAQRTIVRDGLFSVAELMRSEPLRIEGSEHSMGHLL